MRSPPAATRRSSPLRATHPAGTSCFLKPRHPFVVEPSNRSFQPAAFSAGVSWFMSSDETVSAGAGTDAVALAPAAPPDDVVHATGAAAATPRATPRAAVGARPRSSARTRTDSGAY